jgi:hypothetical protein
MADAQVQAERAAASIAEAWRRWNFEQRTAAIASVLLIASTFGPFSFVEGATILTAVAVLLLLKARADHKAFHLPFGDATAIFAAGCWSAFLILVRLFDRPLGQNLLALVCAAILVLAGARERQKRPADDLPPEPVQPPEQAEPPPAPASATEVETAETAALRQPEPAARPARPVSKPGASSPERLKRLADSIPSVDVPVENDSPKGGRPEQPSSENS